MKSTYPGDNSKKKPVANLNKIIRTLLILSFIICNINISHATNWYVSPEGTNSQSSNNGQNPENPLRTISYAFNQAAEPGDTIFVMEGTYRNNGFGNGSLSNGAFVFLNNSGTLNMPIVLTNMPGHEPVIEFDGAGGFTGGAIQHIEISGFTIVGPAENISRTEAMEHRLTQPKPTYYVGRGIAIWGPAHHITIKNNTVSYAPGSGIRVNKGDYINISGNRIFNNCWYTSSAESALVIAEALSIDDHDSLKIIIENNKVWGNKNKIPFFTQIQPNIGVEDYGTEDQDFIIDGSGVYMTRNKDYENGWFYIANNISFNNGINGLVVHRTDRAIVVHNTCYMNGATPLESGRQNSSGITLNNARDVKVYNNISYARYPQDSALGQYGDLFNIDIEANIIFNGTTPFDSGYLYANPLFANADTVETEADFNLQPNSPAIGGGVYNEWVPPFDFAGNPIANIPDIGALQYTDPLLLPESENEFAEVNIFPNPANKVLHIHLKGISSNTVVSVYDMQGRVMISEKACYENEKINIDVSAWPQGTYIVRSIGDNYPLARKITVL